MKRDSEIVRGAPQIQPFVSEPTLTEPTLEAFAHRIIKRQFRYILEQEKGVIADHDPECLHQMRVGFRRLQAALTVLTPVITPGLNFTIGKRVLKRLGRLRDLDVQLQDIDAKKQQTQTPGSHKALIHLQRDLVPQRQRAFQQVCKTLTQKPDYQAFKRQTERWLKHPEYQAIAPLPVRHYAPALLSPIMAQLLLHPAWLLPETSMAQDPVFHDLRKLCKQVRYQSEFFIPFYPKAFKAWIKEIKFIQSGLGEIQDAFVFRQFIQPYLSGQWSRQLNELKHTDFSTNRSPFIHDWNSLKQRYIQPRSRHQLQALILSPNDAE